MNTVKQYAHCRLCATLKSCVELVNLVIKEEMRNLILNKLNRLNINVNFNNTDDRLPWTVCLTCINSLDKAFDFLLEVEEAQKVLENLIDVKDIKTEIQVFDDDIYELSSPVLDENDTQFPTAEVKIKTEVLKTREPKLKRVADPDYKRKLRKSNRTCVRNETFMTPEELDKHSNSCNGDLQIRQLSPIAKQSLNDGLTCTICQKSFKYKETLRNHLSIHTDCKGEQHTCKKCGKIFPGKRNLARHMTSHDSRPFCCEICQSKFRTSKLHKLHVGTHNSAKPLICKQCGRCFLLRRQLMNHKHNLIHTDSMPYICTYCNKGFCLKTSLDQHIRCQHTGVKPYSCQLCKRQFTNWSNYKKHMKTSHGTNMTKKEHAAKGV